ncbi:MAG: AraC family transcriptional regulator [Ruminococcaceae bacterium]|nr:AraC family transcriptional regulator [Oscillospiraceae bacterium]
MDFKSLQPYVRQATDLKIKAPAELPIRWLVAYQIRIVMEGEGILIFNDIPYEISKGDVIFIPPNEPHRYTITKDITQLYIDFDTEYTETSRKRNISSSIPPETLPGYRKIYLQSNVYEKYDLPLIFKPQSIDEYVNYWYGIKNALKKNNSYVIEIKMTKLLNLIHSRLGITKIKDKIDYCEVVKDYIDADFERIITLDEIASLYEINKFTISKKFKERYGISIIAYYNAKRMEFAKNELTKPEASVTKVSECLNFTDVYTFSKFFKMHTGMSPRAYKAQFCKSEQT